MSTFLFSGHENMLHCMVKGTLSMDWLNYSGLFKCPMVITGSSEDTGKTVKVRNRRWDDGSQKLEWCEEVMS